MLRHTCHRHPQQGLQHVFVAGAFTEAESERLDFSVSVLHGDI